MAGGGSYADSIFQTPTHSHESSSFFGISKLIIENTTNYSALRKILFHAVEASIYINLIFVENNNEPKLVHKKLNSDEDLRQVNQTVYRTFSRER